MTDEEGGPYVVAALARRPSTHEEGQRHKYLFASAKRINEFCVVLGNQFYSSDLIVHSHMKWALDYLCQIGVAERFSDPLTDDRYEIFEDRLIQLLDRSDVRLELALRAERLGASWILEALENIKNRMAADSSNSSDC